MKDQQKKIAGVVKVSRKPVKAAWIEAFRGRSEMEARDYQEAFDPKLPRRTALNRLKRLQETGLVARFGRTRATVYRLTELGRRRLGMEDQAERGHEAWSEGNWVMHDERGTGEDGMGVRSGIGCQARGGVRRGEADGMGVRKYNAGDEKIRMETESIRRDYRDGDLRNLGYVGIDTGWDDGSGASPRFVKEEPVLGTPGEVSGGTGEVLRALRRPFSERERVGYRREFLDDYRPNETWYLPADLRAHLAEVGARPGAMPDSARTYARQVCERLLIDLSWSSSRLEGNTYSLLETEQLLLAGRTRNGELSREAVMILNHKAAIEFLLDGENQTGFDRRSILNLHALLTADLLPDPADEGRLRWVPVAIGRSAYLPPSIPALIEDAFEIILEKARAIEDPFEQAFFAMVHIPYLQPFLDGNKRVSRLAAIMPLVGHGLAPLSFLEVSVRDYTDAMLAVYEFNEVALLRNLFAQAYEKSARRYTAVRGELGAPDPIRVRYRGVILGLVGEVVRSRLSRGEAASMVRRQAAREVPEAEREAFISAVEKSLSGLHEGNFARYRIRASEFDAWKDVWDFVERDARV